LVLFAIAEIAVIAENPFASMFETPYWF